MPSQRSKFRVLHKTAFCVPSSLSRTRSCFPFGEQILSKKPHSNLRITIKNTCLITSSHNTVPRRACCMFVPALSTGVSPRPGLIFHASLYFSAGHRVGAEFNRCPTEFKGKRALLPMLSSDYEVAPAAACIRMSSGFCDLTFVSPSLGRLWTTGAICRTIQSHLSSTT